MNFKHVVATLSGLSAFAIATAGSAGASYSAGAYCNKYADGSGSCSGSFNGFRSAVIPGDDAGALDPNAFAAFWNEGSAYAQFVAELNGTYYACTTTTPNSAWFAISSGPSTTSFSVMWGADGTCTSVSMEAGSQFQMSLRRGLAEIAFVAGVAVAVGTGVAHNRSQNARIDEATRSLAQRQGGCGTARIRRTRTDPRRCTWRQRRSSRTRPRR